MLVRDSQTVQLHPTATSVLTSALPLQYVLRSEETFLLATNIVFYFFKLKFSNNTIYFYLEVFHKLNLHRQKTKNNILTVFHRSDNINLVYERHQVKINILLLEHFNFQIKIQYSFIYDK